MLDRIFPEPPDPDRMYEFDVPTKDDRTRDAAARFPWPINWALAWCIRRRPKGRVACWLRARHARKTADALGLGQRRVTDQITRKDCG